MELVLRRASVVDYAAVSLDLLEQSFGASGERKEREKEEGGLIFDSSLLQL